MKLSRDSERIEESYNFSRTLVISKTKTRCENVEF